MNASSNPPPGGPARTVFEIGAPVDRSPAPADVPSGRGRVIAWSAFAVIAVLAIALTNLAGVGSDGPPRSAPAAVQQPTLSWGTTPAEPVETADAADTAGRSVAQESEPAEPSTRAPKAAAVAKPAAKPKAKASATPKPTPSAVKPTSTPGLALPGARCLEKSRRGHTRNGDVLDCLRESNDGPWRWQLPRSGQADNSAWGRQQNAQRSDRGATNQQSSNRYGSGSGDRWPW